MDRPKHATIFCQKNSWYISYYDEQGRRRRISTGTNNRKAAAEKCRQFERDMLNGAVDFHRQVSDALQDPVRRDTLLAALDRGTPVTLRTALDEYDTQAFSYKRPKTITNDRGRLEAFFKEVPLQWVSDLTTKAINEYIARRVVKDGWVPTTVLRLREILHAFYEFARKNGYVKINPVSNVPRPRIHDRDIRFLDLKQIGGALEAAADTPLEAVVATAIYAGLRREEICWLTVGDIDVSEEHPMIRVRAKTVGDESWMPKTKKNRTVPVSKALRPYLARQALKAKKETWFFHTTEKCRWDPDNLSHHLSDLLDKKNLAWNFLDFRHTFGSQLAQKGVSLYKISELMGNSPEIARRHYARLLPENMHAEVEFGTDATGSGKGIKTRKVKG
jgi:integrase